MKKKRNLRIKEEECSLSPAGGGSSSIKGDSNWGGQRRLGLQNDARIESQRSSIGVTEAGIIKQLKNSEE
jgi:hypothetical protein